MLRSSHKVFVMLESPRCVSVMLESSSHMFVMLRMMVLVHSPSRLVCNGAGCVQPRRHHEQQRGIFQPHARINTRGGRSLRVHALVRNVRACEDHVVVGRGGEATEERRVYAVGFRLAQASCRPCGGSRAPSAARTSFHPLGPDCNLQPGPRTGGRVYGGEHVGRSTSWWERRRGWFQVEGQVISDDERRLRERLRMRSPGLFQHGLQALQVCFDGLRRDVERQSETVANKRQLGAPARSSLETNHLAGHLGGH